MVPRPAPPSIGRCSAASRSFLRGPDGPAGAPPGHNLRSGAYMAASRKRDTNKISPIRVSTLSGEPRPSQHGSQSDPRSLAWHFLVLMADGRGAWRTSWNRVADAASWQNDVPRPGSPVDNRFQFGSPPP